MKLVSLAGRKLRAKERVRHAVIRRHRLGDDEVDFSPIRGAEGISLATRLTREAWTLSGRPWPDYARKDTLYHFTTTQE